MFQIKVSTLLQFDRTAWWK